MNNQPVSDEFVKLVRDCFIENYVRRNQVANPAKDTSLYQVLESCAVTLAPLFALVPGAVESLQATMESDRTEMIQPEPDPLAVEPMKVNENAGKFIDDDPMKPAPTKWITNPARDDSPDDWPCFVKADQ